MEPADSDYPVMDIPIPSNLIPRVARNKMCAHLDIGTEGNWEMCAEVLSVETLDILAIKSRHCPEGFADRMLQQIGNRVTVPQLADALKTIGNYAALSVLCQSYPAMKAMYEEKMKNQSAVQQPCQRRQPHRETRILQREIHTGREHYYAPMTSSLPSYTSRSSNISLFRGKARQTKVLLTYADCASANYHDCKKIRRHLKNKNIDVVAADGVRDLDSLGHSFSEADFILVLISNGYRRIVEDQNCNAGPGSGNGKNCDELARYIHRRMFVEYNNLGFQNRRFLPVRLPNSNYPDDVPWWMQDTIVYTWPEDKQKLFTIILEYRRTSPSNRCS